MKKICLIALVFVAAALSAQTFPPELRDFAEGFMDSDSTLISIGPYTQETPALLTKLRSDEYSQEHNLIIVERDIGPSLSPISSDLISFEKDLARADIASSLDSFIRKESYSLLHRMGLSTNVLSKLVTTNIIEERLRNDREVLRLNWRFRTKDGQTAYGTSFWLAIEKPTPETIKQHVESMISGGKSANTNKTLIPSKPVESDTANLGLIATVEAYLNADEQIQNYKAQNRWLLGFDD